MLDAAEFTGQADGVSWGRWPDGADDFYALQTRTPGAKKNSAIVIGPVAINELMYDPISGSDDDQYIELFNPSSNAVSLAGWQPYGGGDVCVSAGRGDRGERLRGGGAQCRESAGEIFESDDGDGVWKLQWKNWRTTGSGWR